MYDIGKTIKNMPAGSGNCVEMAALAGYEARETYNVAWKFLYSANVMPPGDHVFTVVTDTIVSKPFASVREFTETSCVKKWLIIDPWLNVCCTANAYLELGSKKLNQWSAQGKRIRWTGSVGDGWYEPGGEYDLAFAQSPLKFKGFGLR
jgi:hypothetical protein